MCVGDQALFATPLIKTESGLAELFEVGVWVPIYVCVSVSK